MKHLTIAASLGALLMLTACATTGETTTAAAPAPAPAPKAAPAPNPAIALGAATFQARCSGCHSGTGRAPAREVLRGKSHADIVTALTTGKMAAQGRNLTDEDKANVATFLTQGPA